MQQTISSKQFSIGGYDLHPTLEQWHLLYLFGTAHSVETKQIINEVRMACGAHTSQMTQQPQLPAIYKVRDQLQGS